mgnify:CR=1 FL=1
MSSPSPIQLQSPRSVSLSALLTERVRLVTVCALARQRSDAAAWATADAGIEALDAELAGPIGGSLRRLSTLFRLSEIDCDVLVVCLGLALDPALSTRFAALDSSVGRGYVTEPLVAQLFGHAPGRLWNPAGALALWGLVRAQLTGPGEPACLSLDPVVPAWLDGTLWIDRSLAGLVRTTDSTLRVPSWPLETLVAAARRALELGRPIQFLLTGEQGSGRTALAAAVAERVNLATLVVDTTEIAEIDWPDCYMRLQRPAAVSGTALVWTGANVWRPWPALVAPAPVHFLALEPGETPRTPSEMLVHRIEMPEPTIEERQALWRELLPAVQDWPAGELETLASRYRLGASDIASIAAHGPTTPPHVAHAARTCHSSKLDEVVQAIECPYGWDDLVLPDALLTALSDFAFEIGQRERIWQERAAGRLFPREPSLAALFCGPSGTGKTMAAQVVAASLHLDLLRVDLASVMSKYIGETAKNLSRVFALARRRQAIVLFDEADAHFARRTEIKDAHDRYANADTNYLLQLLEAHRGAVILATNRRSDMDPAFIRRLRHVLEFPRPPAPERLKLWTKALTAVGPSEWPSLERSVMRIAESIDVSGAQIRNATLSALFSARRAGAPLALSHVLQGLDRELLKEGRPVASKQEGWLVDA